MCRAELRGSPTGWDLRFRPEKGDREGLSARPDGSCASDRLKDHQTDLFMPVSLSPSLFAGLLTPVSSPRSLHARPFTPVSLMRCTHDRTTSARSDRRPGRLKPVSSETRGPRPVNDTPNPSLHSVYERSGISVLFHQKKLWFNQKEKGEQPIPFSFFTQVKLNFLTPICRICKLCLPDPR